jgi:hypothetical protein
MKLRDRFSIISKRMKLDYQEAGLGNHNLSKGENREHRLRDFLSDKLPFQYGITSGEILFQDGGLSNQTDIILYDKIHCPILYAEQTSIVPVGGVYGTIEVKSKLSKKELEDAAPKVKKFKENAPRDLSVIQKIEHITLQRPSRPFGIIFGFELADNSLDSLADNWVAIGRDQINNVGEWFNMIVVLGEGIIMLGHPKENGVEHFLDTDALVNFTLNAKEDKNDGNVGYYIYRHGEETLMYFYFYLNAILARTSVAPVDIGRYIDSTLPILVHSIR